MDFKLTNVKRKNLLSNQMESQITSSGTSGPVIFAFAECLHCGFTWEATTARNKGGLEPTSGGVKISCPNCRLMSIVSNSDIT